MKKEATLYKKLSNKEVECFLCSHNCKITPSKFGFCGVRENIDGKLYTWAYGEVIASHVDPIEKKPLYHFLPGTQAFSIATAGCNFRCGFCQNWQISQASQRNGGNLGGYELKPEEIVREAKKAKCKSISYTYTEPTIFFEYALDTAKLAKKEGLYNNFVTNGYMTKEALETIKPYLDAANVDLKFFNDESYKKICQAKLQPVLDSIKLMKKLGIWVEVTTLVVPGQNDSEKELKDIASFIESVGTEIPWHISRFHPDYKFTDSLPTPIESLKKAYDIGKAAGLRYVYLGNVAEESSTYCHKCNRILIKRNFHTIQKDYIKNNAKTKCPSCQTLLDGCF